MRTAGGATRSCASAGSTSTPRGGYRRFFDIDELGGHPPGATRRCSRPPTRRSWSCSPRACSTGLRVDHPDGLADPRGYLERLRERRRRAGLGREDPQAGASPARRCGTGPCAERSATSSSTTPAPCSSIRPPAGELTELLQEATGETRSFAEIAFEAQLEQAPGTVRPRARPPASAWDPSGSASSPRAWRRCRSTEPTSSPGAGASRQRTAKPSRPPERAPSSPRALLLEDRGTPAEFVTRFQQTSPAIAAKGVEDTAFYRYLRLLCLNEVGGDPDRFGLPVEDFHAANLERAERFPRGSARDADARHQALRATCARASGPSTTMTDAWREHVLRWMDLGEALRAPARCARTGPRSTCSTRPSSAPGRSAASGSRATS